MVASLMPGSRTGCAQPVRMATRPRRRPCAGGGPRRPRHGARREVQHRGERLQGGDRGEQLCERPAERGELQRRAEARGIGQDGGENRTGQPVHQRAAVGLLDMGAGVVDQMHVVHAGRAGGHAGEAGQAAVDMGDGLGVGRTAVLQHVLDQIDPAARRIQFVAERHIGRTGRGAETAVDAFAQDLFGFGDMRISELGGGEGGLHQRVRFVGPAN
jgi:hypothetical protein